MVNLSPTTLIKLFSFLLTRDRGFKSVRAPCIYVMRCIIWYQTLKNGIPVAGQNSFLAGQNALKWLSHESVSLNPFVWYSNSYMMFNLSHDIYVVLECHTNGRSRKNSNCSIATKVATLIGTLKADDEIKVRRRIFRFKTLIYVQHIM